MFAKLVGQQRLLLLLREEDKTIKSAESYALIIILTYEDLRELHDARLPCTSLRLESEGIEQRNEVQW